jgi:hypothetical protein
MKPRVRGPGEEEFAKVKPMCLPGYSAEGPTRAGCGSNVGNAVYRLH